MTRGGRPACRARRSGHEPVGRDGSWAGGLLLLLSVPFVTIVLPRLMYMVIAPMKGWC